MYINYEPNRFSAGLKSRLPFKAFNGLIDFDFWCFNATFSNISAISWRPVLVVEEAGVPREKFYKNLQSRARIHAVLVIGLYELLGNPTT